MAATSLKPRDRSLPEYAVSWRAVSPGGEIYGPESKAHLARTFKRVNGRLVRCDQSEMEDWSANCGMCAAAFDVDGVYGPRHVIIRPIDDAPLTNLCKVCFPPVPQLPRTAEGRPFAQLDMFSEESR